MKRFAIAGALLLAIGITLILAAGYWSYRDVVISIPTQERIAVLTFDDGPHPTDTLPMLALLESKGVQATFFLKGRNVQAYPDIARAVQTAGHEIGNHSYSHRPMTAFTRTAMREEVVKTSDIIESVLGFRPVLFRAPYGLQGIGLTRVLEELGMLSIGMGAFGYDWEVFDPQEIANAVLKDVEPGAIILLHDGHGDVDDPAAQDSRTGTVGATGIIIDTLHEQGYRFVTVGEALNLPTHQSALASSGLR